ncbi:MAG: hypothetical protein WCX22_08090 [Methanoregula sp.]
MGDRLKVFGIDIIKGSVRSRSRRPMYALVRMDGSRIESESEVSLFRLFRMLSAEQPNILAVDSIQEIAADQHELFSFLQGLPPQNFQPQQLLLLLLLRLLRLLLLLRALRALCLPECLPASIPPICSKLSPKTS